MSIPKKIHYIWFGGGEKNKDFEKCLESWKKHQPDYEIKEWNESNYNFDNTPPYVKEAYNLGLWSLVTDYVRMDVLYREGGWYLDTDTEILAPFLDDYSEYNFVSPIEITIDSNELIRHYFYTSAIDENKKRINGDDGFVSGIAITAAIMGAQAGFGYMEEVMNMFWKIDFNRRDYPGCIFGGPIGPQIFAKGLEKYGFIYDGVEQKLSANIFITGPEIVRTGEDDKTYDGITKAVHWGTWSWFRKYLEKDGKMQLVLPGGEILTYHMNL